MSYSDPPFDPADYENLQERSRNVPVRQIKIWEQQAKEKQQLEERLAVLEHNQVFTDAGIPVEGPQAQLFRNGYSGEMTVEAVRASFVSTFGGAPNATQQSLDGHLAAQAMASGAPNASATGSSAEMAAMRDAALNRKNWHQGSGKENRELNALLAREGVDPNLRRLDTSQWKLPGQLIGG